MTPKEKKVFLTMIILIFGFLFSGYTIRNAEYMTIAEKYTEKISEIRELRQNIRDREVIYSVREKINNAKEDFLDEVQKKYTDKWSDKVLLGISYRKFDKRFSRIMNNLHEKEKELLYASGENLVSMEVSHVPEKKSPDIIKTAEPEKTEKVPVVKEQIVNMIVKERLSDIQDFISVIHHSKSDSMLVMRADTDISDNDIPSVFEEYEIYKNKMISQYEDEIFEKGDIPVIRGKGRSLKAGNLSFAWIDGKYHIIGESGKTWSDTLIIKAENGLDEYGKAYIYNGKEFFSGVWLKGENSKIQYFDNFGKKVTLHGKRLWITECDERDIIL